MTMGYGMTIDELVQESYDTARSKGWWDEPRSPAELLMLVVSELAEALEDYRVHGEANISGVYYKDGKPEGFAVEIADAVIRIADMAGHYDIPLAQVLREKLDYNEGRPHRHGGKHL